MTEKKYKTFKEYYHGDEEFKKKHISYMLEKVQCPCGAWVSRNNKSRHLHTNLHHKRITNTQEITMIKEEIKKLNKKINELETKRNVMLNKLKKKEKIAN
jgi:TolA-binding protein